MCIGWGGWPVDFVEFQAHAVLMWMKPRYPHPTY